MLRAELLPLLGAAQLTVRFSMLPGRLHTVHEVLRLQAVRPDIYVPIFKGAACKVTPGTRSAVST